MNILLFSHENPLCALFAELRFLERKEDQISVVRTSAAPGSLNNDTLARLGIDGIDEVPEEKRLPELVGDSFDLIITFDEKAKEMTAGNSGHSPHAEHPAVFYIGSPILLHWNLEPCAQTKETNTEVLLELKERIFRRVDGLFEHGVMDSFEYQRQSQQRVFDSFGDGVVLHDESRRIYQFNKTAERLTGLQAKDVLGKRCQKVFGPDGLCGSQCPFDQKESVPIERREYEIDITSQDGVQKRLKVVHTPVEMGSPGSKGVLATIRDVSEVSELRWKLHKHQSFQGIIAISKPMQEVFRAIRQVSVTDYPVLITGESGTGKELVAAAIHRESRRKGGPFVPINCGALPENILESELFGHVRGAFTGAIRDKKGRFELAHTGTLFLDEIGELSPAFQIKLLRVLQEKQFERVGGERTISVDVRIVCATNRDLKKMTERGQFREDLYYRLSVVPIKLPPLRERKEDIPMLTSHIFQQISVVDEKEVKSITTSSMDRLVSYSWPGNVRELINALQFASVRAPSDMIDTEHLPPEIRMAKTETLPQVDTRTPAVPGKRGRKEKLHVETVKDALSKTDGNKVRAARLLGVGRATLYRFISKYDL